MPASPYRSSQPAAAQPRQHGDGFIRKRPRAAPPNSDTRRPAPTAAGRAPAGRTVRQLALAHPRDVSRVLRDTVRHVADGHLVQINVAGTLDLFRRLETALELAVVRGELAEDRRGAVLVTGSGSTAPAVVSTVATPTAAAPPPPPAATVAIDLGVEDDASAAPRLTTEPEDAAPPAPETPPAAEPEAAAAAPEAATPAADDDDGADTPPVPTADTAEVEATPEEPASRRPGRRFGRGAGKAG